MGLEAKKREVLQLLRDYAAFYAPYGGARELNVEAREGYGPAGLIFSGCAFRSRERELLAESYKMLNYALTILRGEDFPAWMSLLCPYLGDPADSSVVAHWRRKASQLESARLFALRHDRAIEKLAGYLENVDLYVAWPKRMSGRQEKQVERANEELFALYKRLRYGDGMKKRQAVQMSAEMCGYSEPRAYVIVRLREGET